MSPTFGPRGTRLWEAYSTAVDGLRGEALLEEACRTADRLDKLDELLRGDHDVWARLTHNTRTEDYELIIDSALSEARQQGNALRQLLTSLPLKGPDDPDGGDGWLDDL